MHRAHPRATRPRPGVVRQGSWTLDRDRTDRVTTAVALARHARGGRRPLRSRRFIPGGTVSRKALVVLVAVGALAAAGCSSSAKSATSNVSTIATGDEDDRRPRPRLHAPGLHAEGERARRRDAGRRFDHRLRPHLVRRHEDPCRTGSRARPPRARSRRRCSRDRAGVSPATRTPRAPATGSSAI